MTERQWIEVEAVLLVELERGCSMTIACDLAGISRKSVYRRIRLDDDARARVDIARRKGALHYP